MSSSRLDLLLVQRGLAESREKAQRLVRAGVVRVKGQVQTKPGHEFPADSIIEIEQAERFVGRGGEKLEAAFAAFPISVEGFVCLDIGASTGGFTDCMIQHGARRVYAVDVGRTQLHEKLRADPRVTVMDQTNARYLEASAFSEPPQFAAADVSFISLTKVLPAITRVLASGAGLVTLIKPQFEAGREQVEKGGVVRDPAVREKVCREVREFGCSLGLEWMGICESPLKGPAGNIEFLAWWRKQ